MSGFTTARHTLADALAAAVPDGTTVTASLPSNVTAPAVSILAGTAELQTGCLWAADFTLQMVGPGGDNEAGVAALEDLAAVVAAVVAGLFPDARIVLQPPTVAPIAGTSYLTQDAEITVLIPLEA